jgi:hypothetical protein
MNQYSHLTTHPDIDSAKVNHLGLLSSELNDFLDLSSVDFLENDWLDQLLNRQDFILTLNVADQAALNAIHLYTEQRNQLRKNGLPCLGIGYPLVHWEDDNHKIVAPLLIWQITLELSPNTGHSWIINHREPFRRCFVNPLVAEKLQAESGFSWEITEGETALDPKKIIADLLHLTSQDWHGDQGNLIALSNVQQKSNPAEPLSILPAAILGIFKKTNPYTVLEGNAGWPSESSLKDRAQPFPYHELDPWQASVWKKLPFQPINVINGAAGTGKRYLTQNIIHNAVANGEKCLVINTHFSAAQSFTQRLALDGLEHLTYLLREPRTEEAALWKLLAAEQKEKKGQPRFSAITFQQSLQKLNRLELKLEQSYQALRRPVIGSNNWTEAVGLFLDNQKHERRELLSALLQAQDYGFDELNYERFQTLIATANPLFHTIHTFNHPLNGLSKSIFLKKNWAGAAQWAADKLQRFNTRFGALLHEYITGINQYGDNLRTVLEQSNKLVRNQLEILIQAIATGEQSHGASFLTVTTGQLRLLGTLSLKKRNLWQDRQQVFELYDQLKESYRRNTQFDFEWPVLSRIKNLQQVKSLAEQFQKALQAWQNDLPQYLQEETTRLSSKTVQQKLVTSTLPLNLEEKMDALLHELNDSELLAEPVVHQLLTLQKRQKFLEQTQTNLEHLLRNMRDFEAFYPWQQFWLSLNEPEQKVIQALATIKTSNWEIAFKSWFLHQALQTST